jgi:carbon storage regulator
MLVLSRKLNQSVVIGNNIEITVIEIRGNKVRLGIVAPKDVPVHRDEIFKATKSKLPPTDSSKPTRSVV